MKTIMQDGKKILFILLLFGSLISCCLFSSCEETTEREEVVSTMQENINLGKRFVTKSLGATKYLIIDRETKVQYLFYGYDHNGGLTVLLNPDGTPMLYEGKL